MPRNRATAVPAHEAKSPTLSPRPDRPRAEPTDRPSSLRASGPGQSDLFKAPFVQLGVNAGAPQGLVSQDIGHLLERRSAPHQVSGHGVTQPMRAQTRALDAGLFEHALTHLRNGGRP